MIPNWVLLAASLGLCPYLEFPYDPPKWTPEARDFMLAEPFRTDEEGYVKVPEGPGLGIELDDDAIADKLYDGSWDTPRWFFEDDGSFGDW